MPIFRQLFDPQSSTYTYLLACEHTREALLIDPVFEQVSRDMALVNELGLKLALTIETHIHADHITGAGLHRLRSGSRIAVPSDSGAAGADLYIRHGQMIPFGRHALEARSTPGHTRSCTSYVMADQIMAFTGDCLLIRGCGRTDFSREIRTLCIVRFIAKSFLCRSIACSTRRMTIAA